MSTDRRKFFKTFGIATAGLATGFHTDLLGIPPGIDQDQTTGKPTSTPQFNSLPMAVNRARPITHGEALINPDMGWMTYFL